MMSGLYIHIPFCKKRCGYCDFYSTVGTARINDYLNALEKEMALYASEWSSHEFRTQFIGGGTPSILSSDQLTRLFRDMRKHFQIALETEISIEVNPGTLTEEKLETFLQLGINRLSIGVQSLNNNELQLLDRIHSAETVKLSILKARNIGFKNIGLDLIFGLPGQSLNRWRDNVEQAVELEPEHISAYSLTWSEHTPMGRRIISGQLHEPEESLISDMFLWTHEYLTDNNYEHYEISNYAKPNHHCRHNLNYWNDTPYLGLGASAHSYDQNRRWWNVSDVDTYLKHLNSAAVSEQLTDDQIRIETISLGLRTSHGITLDLCHSHPKIIDRYVKDGFARILNQRLILTPKGFLMADKIAEQLI